MPFLRRHSEAVTSIHHHWTIDISHSVEQFHRRLQISRDPPTRYLPVSACNPRRVSLMQLSTTHFSPGVFFGATGMEIGTGFFSLLAVISGLSHGVSKQLAFLNAVEVSLSWISPVCASNGDRFSRLWYFLSGQVQSISLVCTIVSVFQC